MTQETWSVLSKSIFEEDIIILIFAIVEFAVLAIMIGVSSSIGMVKKNREKRAYGLPRSVYIWLRILNTMFLTILTIFPLLGMFGTVNGLLGLDLATGNMDNIRANFFVALTSTAWGIVFSVLYKLIYALFSDYIEDQIEFANRLSSKPRNRPPQRQRGSYEET